MNMWTTLGTAGGAFMLMAVGAQADVLLHQPHDFRYAPRSEWQWNLLSPQRGDDFKPSGPVIVESVTFWMVATWAQPPHNWAFAVHRSTDDHQYLDFAPEYPWIYERTGPSDLINHGPWKNDPELHLFEVRFDEVNLYLDPAETLKGTYWFSAFGHIMDRNLQYAGWGSSGNGTYTGEFAWWKTIPWTHPGWRGYSFPDGSRSDLAMRIEGTYIPAPGAVIPFFALLALRQRRRRSSIG